MDRAAILEKVRDLVSETLECDRDSVEEGTSFSDLGADSFDLLELVTAFEDEFGKTLDDDALQGIETVKDAVDGIANAQ